MQRLKQRKPLSSFRAERNYRSARRIFGVDKVENISERLVIAKRHSTRQSQELTVFASTKRQERGVTISRFLSRMVGIC